MTGLFNEGVMCRSMFWLGAIASLPSKTATTHLYFFIFVYELNKQDIKCHLVRLRGSGRQIMLPLDRAMLAVSPSFQSLC